MILALAQFGVQFLAVFPGIADARGMARISVNSNFFVPMHQDWCNNSGPWIALIKLQKLQNV
jgi:hypothetical protein